MPLAAFALQPRFHAPTESVYLQAATQLVGRSLSNAAAHPGARELSTTGSNNFLSYPAALSVRPSQLRSDRPAGKERFLLTHHIAVN